MNFETNELPIFVPTPDEMERTSLAPGSAIIGIKYVDEERTQVLCYYEGNIYNACNMETFEDKCMFAAARGVQKAPTVAFSVFPIESLKQVGVYDYTAFNAHVTDTEAVEEWEAIDLDNAFTP